MTCARKDEARELAEFYRLKGLGETTVTLNRYHTHYHSVRFPDGLSCISLRRHVIKCLGLDPRTGKKLKS
jgi:hypothetical protein